MNSTDTPVAVASMEGLVGTAPSAPMTEREFVSRAALRYMARAGLTPEDAKSYADVLWDGGKALADLDIETPESMVDEDLSYWTDDGA